MVGTRAGGQLVPTEAMFLQPSRIPNLESEEFARFLLSGAEARDPGPPRGFDPDFAG
jgi:hypothetical protein